MSEVSPPARRARVRALAKINLDLRVLNQRPDDYHELRTIFQTISLADTLEIAFTPRRETAIEISQNPDIPDNLAARAAGLVLDAMRIRGRVEMRIEKRIPVGAGLGGGSSDAAAVLLTVPALAGRVLDPPQLLKLGACLGSDVPFFLLGGTALGIGRGTELYPMPDRPPTPGLLITPGWRVSTAEAYRRLSPGLTSESQENKIFSFQSYAWNLSGKETAANDFETVVFGQHRQLAVAKKRLIRAGALAALMTGSGSAVFGLFRNRSEVSRALKLLEGENALEFSLVSRARYRSMWWRALEAHIEGKQWPPRSRYAR
jgi:4-diphosphocytidyl-2-C-methyl-D-erythritol kinase